MSGFISNLDLIASFVFDFGLDLFNTMMSHPILTASIALWVLDRIFGIFDYLKG